MLLLKDPARVTDSNDHGIGSEVRATKITNGANNESAYAIHTILVDASGNPISLGSSGGGSSSSYGIADSMVTDSSGAYYIRRERVDATGAVTFVYTNLDGTAATPASGVAPVTQNLVTIGSNTYDATNTATGVTIGDVILETVLRNQETGANVTVWTNLNSGTTIANPGAGNIKDQDQNVKGTFTQLVGGTAVGPGNPLPVSNPIIGIGAWQFVPTTGTTTAPVSFGTKPSGAIGVELYLPAGSSVNANIDTSAPNVATQISGGITPQYDYATLGKIVQINLGTSVNLYESVVVGAPYFRWI